MSLPSQTVSVHAVDPAVLRHEVVWGLLHLAISPVRSRPVTNRLTRAVLDLRISTLWNAIPALLLSWSICLRTVRGILPRLSRWPPGTQQQVAALRIARTRGTQRHPCTAIGKENTKSNRTRTTSRLTSEVNFGVQENELTDSPFLWRLQGGLKQYQE